MTKAGDGIVRDIDASLFQEIGDGSERSLSAAQFGDAFPVGHKGLNLSADATLVIFDSGIERLLRQLRRGSVVHLTGILTWLRWRPSACCVEPLTGVCRWCVAVLTCDLQGCVKASARLTAGFLQASDTALTVL